MNHDARERYEEVSQALHRRMLADENGTEVVPTGEVEVAIASLPASALEGLVLAVDARLGHERLDDRLSKEKNSGHLFGRLPRASLR